MTVEVQAERRNASTGKLPSVHFRDYCLAEFERQRNSGNAFDEEDYRAAMTLVLAKLEMLEEQQSR